MRKRATKSELQDRVNLIVELIIQGYDRGSIVAFFKEKYGVKPETVDIRYMPKARVKIAEQGREKTKIELEIANCRFLDLYRISYQAPDWQECLRVQKAICKLNGLYPSKKCKSSKTDNIAFVPSIIFIPADQLSASILAEVNI